LGSWAYGSDARLAGNLRNRALAHDPLPLMSASGRFYGPPDKKVHFVLDTLSQLAKLIAHKQEIPQ
jgi:hypothetical protein